MTTRRSSCPHVTTVGDNSWEDVLLKKKVQTTCHTCHAHGPNLWLCLHSSCLYVGCGESAVDHSGSHAEAKKHFLTLNMTTERIWCYRCETEVYRHANDPPLIMRERSVLSLHQDSPSLTSTSPTGRAGIGSASGVVEDSETDDEDENQKPRGLVGLQNIGNTCYMNAALQALSNCPPLTRYFLDCAGSVRPEVKPMLSKSYMKLVQEIWSKKRPSYVIPSGVAHGIKIIHPMFRGYTQQDTQEFLRCFMDQVHEELKQPLPHTTDTEEEVQQEADSSPDDGSDTAMLEGQPLVDSVSQSDTDYETCDSGLSSERSSIGHAQLDDCGDSGADSATQKNSFSKQGEKEGSSHSDIGSSENSSVVCESNNINKTDKNVEQEAVEYMDAVSVKDGETGAGQEPSISETQVQKSQGQRSRCTSENDKVAVRGPLASKPSQQGKKKKAQECGSVISDIFDGKILSTVQCLTCERVSSMKETFQDLSLPIPSKDHIHMLHANQGTTIKGTCGEVNLHQGWFSWVFSWMKSWFWGPGITLQDCLAAFFSADELKGDNMYSCEKCKKLRNGVKYSKVMKLPEILCIHLKRFRHEFMFSSKISSYVSFPMEGLDMGPCLHKDCQDTVTTYDLIGVICHHGTAGGGHYTAYCLNHLNEQWYEFDDQYVTEVDIQQVENCEAYVLFYRKKNDLMYSQRQKAADLLETGENGFMKFYISKQWINRFNTFAEPGPINNGDILCKHGGVPPTRWLYYEELFTELPQPVWEMFHQQYGGGPAVNHLYLCTICQNEMERLKKRQKVEMETFLRLLNEFQNEENPAFIYAVSMSWFKEWENFVKGKTDDPPGPVDNSPVTVVKNGVTQVKPSSDYGQISQDMWHFFFDMYGGGPELILKQNARPATPAMEVAEVEVSTGPSKADSSRT